MIESVPISLLLSGIYCLTILCATALILAWKSLSRNGTFVPEKAYLWVPICVGIVVLGLADAYYSRGIFYIVLLLIGAFYFSDIAHILSEFFHRERNSVKEKSKGEKDA